MMWLLLLKFGLDFSTSLAAELLDSYLLGFFWAIFVAIAVGIGYQAFQLSRAIYGIGPAIVCVLIVCMPCLGSFAVLVLNGNAIDQLRKMGIKVGFMGASAMQLEALHASIASGKQFSEL